MSNTNVVVVVGNLTKAPELRTTPSGTSVCSFSVAVNEYYKGEQRASFFEVVAWGKVAENVDKYLDKGSKVAVQGNLKQDRWENDKGDKRSKVKINAFSVEFLTPKKKNDTEDSDLEDAINDEDDTEGSELENAINDDKGSKDKPF
jgi:single-strand DNA-binding protein